MKHRETVVKKIVKMEISISLPEEQDHNCAHIIFILVKSERCLYSCWLVDGGSHCLNQSGRI